MLLAASWVGGTESLPVLMFCEFGLKMPIHAPFWVVFWGFDSNPDMTICNVFDVYVFILWRTAH